MNKDHFMIVRSIFLSMLLMISSTFASAKVTQVNYKAKFGIFGTVGTIKNRLDQNKKTYQIDTTVKLAGLAKIIMGGQTEHYISKGHMEKGKMVSDLYQMISKKKHKKVSKEYRIDHKRKFVTKRYRKWKDGKLVEDRKERLKFYAKDDLLTLYFNMDKAITQKGKVYTIKAVGLEKQKGIVKVTVPTDAKATPYKKDLGKSADWYAKALIVQKNFRKKKGEILLSVDKDKFIKKAVIKDVLLYGDAKLIRTK
jgi:hypothetical protein